MNASEHRVGGGTVLADESVQDGRLLRTVFGAFATGVTVLTVGGPVPYAITANSFTSVSIDPPLVLVCVERDAAMHDKLLAAGSFAVSVLAADQEHVARHFADRWRPRGPEQFDGIGWRPGQRSGAPLIDGALAWIECGLWRAYGGGDHSIFVGRLLSVRLHERRDMLLFLYGRFRRLAVDPPAR